MNVEVKRPEIRTARKPPRRFVLVLADHDLTVGELTKALSRTAGQIDSGRLPLERGEVRNTAGKQIGNYYWEDSS
jgi:hypothetical protein